MFKCLPIVLSMATTKKKNTNRISLSFELKVKVTFSKPAATATAKLDVGLRKFQLTINNLSPLTDGKEVFTLKNGRLKNKDESLLINGINLHFLKNNEYVDIEAFCVSLKLRERVKIGCEIGKTDLKKIMDVMGDINIRLSIFQ